MKNLKTMYEGPRFTVQRADFEAGTREWVNPGNVVAVIPYDDEYVWLGEQMREVIGELQLGPCAGKIDDGETPLVAARRELREEFGMTAERMACVDIFWSSEGFTNERCWLWFATGLKEGKATDPSEGIKVIKCPVDHVYSLATGTSNVKAKLGLMHLARMLGK